MIEEEDVKSRFSSVDYITEENKRVNMMIEKKRKFDTISFNNVANRKDGTSLFLMARFAFEVEDDVPKCLFFLSAALEQENADAYFLIYYLIWSKKISYKIFKTEFKTAMRKAKELRQLDMLFVCYIFDKGKNNSVPMDRLLEIANLGHAWARLLFTNMYPEETIVWTNSVNRFDILKETIENSTLISNTLKNL